MKKLMEARLERNSSSLHKEIKNYTIEVEYIKLETSVHISKEVMVRKAQAIKRLTRWNIAPRKRLASNTRHKQETRSSALHLGADILLSKEK